MIKNERALIILLCCVISVIPVHAWDPTRTNMDVSNYLGEAYSDDGNISYNGPSFVDQCIAVSDYYHYYQDSVATCNAIKNAYTVKWVAVDSYYTPNCGIGNFPDNFPVEYGGGKPPDGSRLRLMVTVPDIDWAWVAGYYHYNSIPRHEKAIASFDTTPQSGTAPLTIQLTDTSTQTAGVTYFKWDFGNGQTLEGDWPNPANPVNTTYTSTGNYTITYNLTYLGGTSQATKTIQVTSATLATNFTSTLTSGTAPLTVRFTDTSTGSPTAWSWNFGDGSNSTVQNPSHTYSSAGTYDVSMTASNATGTNTMTRAGYVTVRAPVVWDVTGAGECTNNLGEAYSDDGNISYTGPSFVDQCVAISDYNHFYPDSVATCNAMKNAYTIKWIAVDSSHTPHCGIGDLPDNFPVDGGCGSTNCSLRLFITVPDIDWAWWVGYYHYNSIPRYEKAIASFDISPQNGTAPLIIYLSDTSTQTANVTHFTWDFGNGQILEGNWSNPVNPVNTTYAAAGNYTITYNLTYPGGTSQATKTIQVASAALAANFTGTPTSGSAPLTVQFTDTSTGSPTSWSWNFGDGGSSTVQNPSHTYSSAGTYDVSMTATGVGGSNTTTKAGYVTVGAAPVTYQATDVAGRTITQPDIDYAANQQQLMNYHVKKIYNGIPLDIKPRLPNDQVFFFSGHGKPGAIQLNDTLIGSEENLFYANNNSDSFNDASQSYSNLKLAVFFGCDTGETSPINGNLVDVVVSKDAGCAMGWTSPIATDGQHSYISAFWSALQNGNTIMQAHEDGKNAAKDDPFCQSLTPPEVYQYCLFEHLYSQGSSCSQSLPTGMTDQIIQSIKMDSSSQQYDQTMARIPTKSHLLSEQQAIRKFSSDIQDKDPVYKQTTHYSYGDLDTFSTNDFTYKVNRNNGRIQSQYYNKIESSSGNDIISIDKGFLIAEGYAKEKCPEFWKNETGKVIKKNNPTAKDHELAYSWRQYFVFSNSTSSDSPEIAGFNLIDVILDARDGKIKSYHEWYVPRDKNLRLNPELSEDQAWETVKKYFKEKGIGTLDATQRNNLGLVISIDDNSIQHLGWQFEIKKSEIKPNYYGGQIIVDAHNGQIIRHIRFG